jgi:hypothetical protein
MSTWGMGGGVKLCRYSTVDKRIERGHSSRGATQAEQHAQQAVQNLVTEQAEQLAQLQG